MGSTSAARTDRATKDSPTPASAPAPPTRDPSSATRDSSRAPKAAAPAAPAAATTNPNPPSEPIHRGRAMFNFRERPAMYGSGYIVLNIQRALNLVVLAAVAAASVLMMAFAKLPNAFQFFTDIDLFFIVCLCFLLGWSELPLPAASAGQAWLRSTWPVLGDRHGFVWLGTALFLMGCHTLGRLSGSPYELDQVGEPVWRAIAAAGCLGIAVGVINVVLSLLYGGSGVTARMVRSDGATTDPDKHRDDDAPPPGYTYGYGSGSGSERSASVRKEEKSVRKSKGVSRLFGRARAAATRPNISSPQPAHHDLEAGRPAQLHQHQHQHQQEENATSRSLQPTPEQHQRGFDALPESAGAPSSRASPIAPEVQRPPTALHPAYAHRFRADSVGGGDAEFLAPGHNFDTRYSVASGLTQFTNQPTTQPKFHRHESFNVTPDNKF